MGDKNLYSQGYINTIKQLETIHGAVGGETIQISAAISLKRIADSLEKLEIYLDRIARSR